MTLMPSVAEMTPPCRPPGHDRAFARLLAEAPGGPSGPPEADGEADGLELALDKSLSDEEAKSWPLIGAVCHADCAELALNVSGSVTRDWWCLGGNGTSAGVANLVNVSSFSGFAHNDTYYLCECPSQESAIAAAYVATSCHDAHSVRRGAITRCALRRSLELAAAPLVRLLCPHAPDRRVRAFSSSRSIWRCDPLGDVTDLAM